MTIYRGPGGASETTDEATISAVQTYASQAATSATQAASSASTAASNATSASTAATQAATSATNAASSAASVASYVSQASGYATTAATEADDATYSADQAALSAGSASTSATNASNSAASAASSATAAASSATSAASSATAAASSASTASSAVTDAQALYGDATALNTAVTAAASSATAAASSASTASSAASSAAASATAASDWASDAQAAVAAVQDSVAQANILLDDFRDTYLGAFPVSPYLDNKGNPLTVGDRYFDTSLNEELVWNGSEWQSPVVIGGTVSTINVTSNTALMNHLTVGDNLQANVDEWTFDYGVIQLGEGAHVWGANNSSLIMGWGTNWITSPDTAITYINDGYGSFYNVYDDLQQIGFFPQGSAGETWNPIVHGPIEYTVSVRAGGKVGINKTSPTVALDVVGDAHITGTATMGDTSSTSAQNLYIARGGNNTLGAIGSLVFNAPNFATTPINYASIKGWVSNKTTGSEQGALFLYAYRGGVEETVTTFSPVSTTFYSENTERMRLTSTGLGIGTSSPTNALSVTGNANITGNTTLGDATTDTVTVNGYMGVGTAPVAGQGFRVKPSALTGANQYGSILSIEGTASATSSIEAVRVQASTAAASFTTGYVAGMWVRDAILGAGSTITSNYGIYVDDKTVGTNNYGITSLVSSGTNKWNIYASGTAANYFAGNVGIGTSSIGTGVTFHTLGTSRIANSSGGALQLEDTNVADNSLPFWVLQSDEGVFRLLSANRSGTGTTGSTTRFSTSIVESVFNDTGADIDFRVESDTNTHALFVDAGNSSVGLGGASFGSGNGVVYIANATTAPTTNPTGGGILYCEGGALKYRGSSGTVTTLAAA